MSAEKSHVLNNRGTWDAIEGEPTDLTSPRRDVRFRVDGEDFEGVQEVPALVAFELPERLERLTGPSATSATRLEDLHAVIDGLLLPESAERFKARLGDPARPIGLATVLNVITWLAQRFGESASVAETVS